MFVINDGIFAIAPVKQYISFCGQERMKYLEKVLGDSAEEHAKLLAKQKKDGVFEFLKHSVGEAFPSKPGMWNVSHQKGTLKSCDSFCKTRRLLEVGMVDDLEVSQICEGV